MSDIIRRVRRLVSPDQDVDRLKRALEHERDQHRATRRRVHELEHRLARQQHPECPPLASPTTMTAAHHAHVDRIIGQFETEVRAKYARGQREHGGNLWERQGLLEAAIEEVVDIVTYLYTLREQHHGQRDRP